jgi:hypothetical protein
MRVDLSILFGRSISEFMVLFVYKEAKLTPQFAYDKLHEFSFR